MSQTTISNTLSGLQNALNARSNNIANAKAVGAFAVDPQFMSQATTGLGGGSTLFQRNNFLTKGEFVQTGKDSDLAIGGVGTTGFFAVKLPNGAFAYTPNGSMQLDTNQQLLLADRSVVMGWQLDASGNLPTNRSTTSSLTPLSLQGVTSKAIPTTTIGLVMNLDQSQDTLKGPGGKLTPSISSVLNIASIDSIITPNDQSSGALHLGDEFRLTSIPAGSIAGTEKIFEYGGIAMSKAITPTSPIFGTVTDTGTAIPVSATPGANQLSSTYNLQIAVSGVGGGGGSSFTFYASASSGSTSTGYFSSVADLAAAITATGQMRATISGGRIYIAGKDADFSLTFTENNVGAGASLLTILAIDNVPAPNILGAKFDPTTPTRFASIHELQQKINSSNAGLTSTINGVGLTFGSDSPLNSLTLGGRSLNARSIYSVTAGYNPGTPNYGTWPQNTVATINANGHFLNSGDYVRLTGSGLGALNDGLYKVLTSTTDSFVVATSADLGAGAIGATVAVPNTGAFTWQKVDGGTTQPTISANAGTNCATNAVNSAVFTGLVNDLASLQLAVGDVVYVKNSNSIQDGYYRVTAQGAGTLTLAISGSGITPAAAATNAYAFWHNGGGFILSTVGAAAEVVHAGEAAAVAVVPVVAAAIAAAATLNGAQTVANANALIADINAVIADATLGFGGTIGTAADVVNAGSGAPTAAAVLVQANLALASAHAALASINAPGGADDYKIAAHAAAVDNAGLNIVKVASSTVQGNAGAFDSFPIETTAGSATVRIHVNPGDNYQTGGIIAFRNLATSPLTFGNNLQITEDRYYTIQNYDSATGIVTFTADLTSGTVAGTVTAGFVGFQNTATSAALGVPGAVTALTAGTFLGVEAYVDYVSAPLSALGLTVNEGQGSSQPDSIILNAPLAATYSANDPNRSFAGGNVIPDFTQTIDVIDSLGDSNQVILAFGKVNNNTWAAEIYLPNDPVTGKYAGAIANPQVAGQLAAGTLQFDGNGQLTGFGDNQGTQGSSISNPINVTWSDAATPLAFSINWGAINGLLNGVPAPAGISQINGNGFSNVTAITNDGKVPGNLNGYEFDEKGIFYATFDNGTTIKVAQIAIATFSNFNGLNLKNGYLYESADSGIVLFKTAGDGGVGQINVGGVTSSAVNDTAEYLGVIDDSQSSAMAVNVAAKINATRDQLVNNLAR